ncbi:MAG: hypothetical protein H0X31_00275 [Nostocaceae cyanobacterium]|nr:hypothetical protein [Nostocaceae cyanobacterium]
MFSFMSEINTLSLQKRRQSFILLGMTTLFLTALSERAYAAGGTATGIFAGAQNAMTCIVTDASGGGAATNAIITNLPVIIFSAIALFLFAYFLGSTFQLVQAVRNGDEATQLIIPILSAMIGIIVAILFQNILFGAGGGC